MNQNAPQNLKESSRRLNILLPKGESEKLKKLARVEERSEGKTAQRLIRGGLKKAEEERRI